MYKRYLGALILSPLIIVLFLGGIYLELVVLLLSLLGMHEFFNVTKHNGKPLNITAYLTCIIYYAFIILNKGDYKFLFFSIVLAIFIVLCIPIFNEECSFVDAAITLLGFLYIGVFFSYIIFTYKTEYGRHLVWIIFISSWMCDTTAYYAGRFLGKHKLCPRVSPKKTIEGSIGGLLGSTLSCGIYGIILNNIGINIPLFNFFLVGIFAGGLCQLGDLAASSIKRSVNIKDYGNLIPGHGGILDRFDSILFASVVVYYYIVIVMGM